MLKQFNIKLRHLVGFAPIKTISYNINNCYN